MDNRTEISSTDYDVLIIGAGLSGIFSLYRMQQLGLKARVFERGAGEGGTWFWNKYPGARFDSESWTYNFFFSQEVLDEWNWTEHFAPQPETLKYCQYLTDKFDLRKNMQFNTKIVSAQYNDDSRTWVLTDEKGCQYTTRFLITAMGVLSKPTLPDIPGVEDFQGQAFHTSRWPDHPVPLNGKRVAIIGTGATAIQIIQEIAKVVGHLTVFQRTANWSAPLHNAKISPEEMDQIRERFPEIIKLCNESYSCFVHKADMRRTLEVPEAERNAFWEDLYARPGFAKWLANFGDIHFDKEANAAFSDFIANKIRQRVSNPETAEKLIPKNHGFGLRRVPLETNYFEVYNQDNVELIDVNENPIERITADGIDLRDDSHKFDVIIYATGFDAITGAFNAIDFRGVGGKTITHAWADGPKTQLGIFVRDFPNMFMVMGPHQMFGNIPRSIEYAVTWISECIRYCHENGITRIEAQSQGVEEWTNHVHEVAKGWLLNDIDSWMTGVNKNIVSKKERLVIRYSGAAPGYRQRCQQVAERNYADLSLA